MPGSPSQVGALPWRIDPQGAVEVMLITSRETRRWVIPKGNEMRGKAPHEAAAQEAWEEAGLTGVIDPFPLGTFRYLKRRIGAVRELEVVVFALAVSGQAADWPEKHQRETRWFAQADAAAAVTEVQLSATITAFSPPAGRRFGVPAPTGRQGMLGWFRALMPKQGRFFEQFDAHAAVIAKGADALASMLKGGDSVAVCIKEIVDREHDADDLARDVLQDVRRVFVTPFDRSAIADLIGSMDDAIDEMNKTASAVELFEVKTFTDEMREMATLIVEAAGVLCQATPLLRSVGSNAAKLNQLTERLVRLEGQADDVHARGLKILFQQTGASDPAGFIVGREIYSHLERITDRFEDVANEIQGLVIDHA